MLSRAEALLAGDPVGPDPWIRDQHEAAASELRPLLREMGKLLRNPQWIQAGRSPREIAFKIAVIESIRERAKPEYRCPHSLTAMPPPLVVELGNGMIAC